MASLPQSRRADLYVRVSTTNQEEDGSSLDTQEAACRQHAARHGYTIGTVYREVYSGVELWERPQLTELRAAMRRREMAAVVVYAIDRLARDPVHLGVVLSEAEHCGVAVHFVTEPLDDSPEGQLIRFVRGYAAKVEHAKIMERTMRGKRARVESGKPMPGPKAPYGYRFRDAAKSGYEIDETTAPIVRRIFREIANGKSLRGMARDLTEEGVPSPGGAPHWAPTTLNWLLSNPLYVGQPQAFRTTGRKVRGAPRRAAMRPEAEHVALPEGTAPALATPEQWAAVRERLATNRHRIARPPRRPEAALLRGGYARCGHCGNNLIVDWVKGEPVYRCSPNNARLHGCPRGGMRATLLDAEIWSRVVAVMTDPACVADELARLQAENPTGDDLARLDRALSDIERRRANLARRVALLDDDDAAAPMLAELKGLSAQRRQLDVGRAAIVARQEGWRQAQDRLAELEHWCREVAGKLGAFGFTEKRMALDTLAVDVQLFGRTHDPRWIATASLPLGDETSESVQYFETFSSSILPVTR